jgi:hypothetical protein
MNTFRTLFYVGASIAGVMVFLLIVPIVWTMRDNTPIIKKSKESHIVYDTVKVNKTVYDTVVIKIYEKIPNTDSGTQRNTDTL